MAQLFINVGLNIILEKNSSLTVDPGVKKLILKQLNRITNNL
jgi:hypothetical protein